MEIKNRIPELFTLSIAKTQTIQHWARHIVDIMHSKRKSTIKIESIQLLSVEDFKEDDSVFYAVAQIDKSHKLILCLNQTLVNRFILENLTKKWNEFDYSIANASLNDLMSHLQLRSHYQFKRIVDVTLDFDFKDMIQVHFEFKVNNEMCSLSLTMHHDLLESYLRRFPDPRSKNLDVMMDVPIMVRVELGSLQRKVKEILEFTQGTLLELDQTINSPCKVIVNNHTIAQGNIVEVNGNFGIVMTKIDDKVDFLK